MRGRMRKVSTLCFTASIVLPFALFVSLMLNYYDLSIGWNILATIAYVLVLCFAAARDFAVEDPRD